MIADCYDKTYDRGDFVARQGDPSTSWFGVAEGLLKVTSGDGNGRITTFTAVPACAWVGEGAVIKREARRYDVAAMRPSRVIHVPRATFMWLLESSIEFCRFIVDHLNERVGQFIAMVEVARIVEPVRRVAGTICNLSHPILLPRSGPFLHISQEEIAELAGLSRSTINQSIAKLRRLKLISMEYTSLLVPDQDLLRDFAHSIDK